MFSSLALAALLTLQVQPNPEYHHFDIQFEGMVIQVFGRTAPNGNIWWDPNLPENALAVASAREKKTRNFGVIREKLRSTGNSEVYTATSPEAQEFMIKAKTNTEVKEEKIHVTVIGTEEEREKVIGDINRHPSFEGLRDKLLVQGYPPDSWAIDPALGYPRGGRPDIIVQLAKGPHNPKGGRVIYRARDYSGGPKRLAEQIRKADPNYHPELDPGIATPFGPINSIWGISALVFLAILILLPGKKQNA